ncbi:MAG: recombination-associated protein RdgC [Candidatus Adiutrix sp.]|nr:recombination-associated protein RdgC [Candidatus Adiutrix sp.]
MGLIKGALSLTRYRVREEPPETLTDDYLSGRLAKNAFIDIEPTPEERSLGWVEFFNHLGVDFNPAVYRFGGLLAFTLRLDTRRLPAPTLGRYCAIREAQYVAQTGRRPNSLARKSLKEAVRSELLLRALVNTELMEVAWLYRENEVWLAAAGEKRREVFEELWGRTFGLALQMEALPVTFGLETLTGQLREALLKSRPAPIWIG